MNCSLSRMLLAFPRADLAEEDRAGLSAHVAGCPHCAGIAAGEAALHGAFAKAMQAVPVPEGLHSKLLREGFAQRGARHRRQFYQWSALAASLLLALGLGFSGYLRSRPAIDSDAVAFSAEQDWELREAPVRDWLVKQDLPGELPLDFDYRHYSFHGKGELAGRETPVVVFHGQFTNRFDAKETHTARVYIVEASRFKLQDLKDVQASLVRVAVHRHPTRPDIAYVIVYTSDTLDPFLKRIVGPKA